MFSTWVQNSTRIKVISVVFISHCFRYKGRLYGGCITVDSPDGSPWCSTETDSHWNHVDGNVATCTNGEG